MLVRVAVPVVLVLAIAASSALAAEPVPVPPALQALEQKMLLIHFNTAHVTGVFVLGDLGTPSEGADLGAQANVCESLIVSTNANVRLSPSGTVASSQLEGGPAIKQISIGRTNYIYEPSVKRYDGGRPWVRSVKEAPSKSSKGLFGAMPAVGEDEPSASTDVFKRLVEAVNQAQSIHEAGQATIDGQQAAEYVVTISMATLLAKHLSQKQIETAKKKNKFFKGIAEATDTLELFLTPDGMPVRTINVIGPRNDGIGVEQDILATNIPVSIHKPPSNLTVGQARLRKLEKRYDRKHPHQPPTLPIQIGHPPADCPSESNKGSEHLPISKSGPGLPRLFAQEDLANPFVGDSKHSWSIRRWLGGARRAKGDLDGQTEPAA
jgi:hypothetical protein